MIDVKRVLVFGLLIACIIILGLCFQKNAREPEVNPKVAAEQATARSKPLVPPAQVEPAKSDHIDENATKSKANQPPPMTNPEGSFYDNEFVSEQHGISFMIPQKWVGRVAITELEEGVEVYYNPRQPVSTKYGSVGFLFAIYKRSTSPVYEHHFDSVGKPRYLTVGEVEYVIGGPTHFDFPDNHPEVKAFMEFGDDIQSVLDTLKILE